MNIGACDRQMPLPFDSAARYLLRDRDTIYGEKVQRRIGSLGIEEVVIAYSDMYSYEPGDRRGRPSASNRADADSDIDLALLADPGDQ